MSPRRTSEYVPITHRDLKPWGDETDYAEGGVKRGVRGLVIMVFEYVLRFIAEQCVRFGDYETGGELYGLFSRGGRPVVFLATGPGPKAVHGRARYQLDTEFCRQCEDVLADGHGLQSMGNWHTHAGMDLSRPSGGDTVRAEEFLSDNGHIDRLIEFIANHRAIRGTSAWSGWWKKASAMPDDEREVRINAFEFTANDGHQRAALRVLHGTPPFLLPLLADPDLAFLGARMHAGTFPMNRILFDEVAPDAAPSSQPVLPEPIREQLMGLAGEVGEKVELTVGPERVVVELPLRDGRIAHIAVSARAPHPVEAVQIEEGDAMTTLSKTAWRGRSGAALSQVYARLQARRRAAPSRKPQTKGPSGPGRLWNL